MLQKTIEFTDQRSARETNETIREEMISKIAPGVSWEMEEAVDMVHQTGRKEGNRTR